jgi:TolA-binding protein
MRTFLFISLLIGSSIIALPAQAQSKKELAAQNIALSQRLTALENRMLTGDPAAERLMQRTDALEASQRSLTGEVERLRYERDTLQAEVKTLAGEIAALQTLAEDMERHLKAVEIVASTPQPQPGMQIDPSTGSLTYGETGTVSGGGVYGGGVYSDGSSLPPPPVILNGPTASIETNDMTQLAQVGLDKLNQGDFSGSQSAFIQYLEYNPDCLRDIPAPAVIHSYKNCRLQIGFRSFFDFEHAFLQCLREARAITNKANSYAHGMKLGDFVSTQNLQE